MDEREAWAAAERRNEKLGAAGTTNEYAVARETDPGTWIVSVTKADPPRSRWKGLREWLQSCKTAAVGPPPREGDPESFEDEVRLLRSPDVHARRIATRDVARLFPDRAEEHVRGQLADDDPVVRSFAIASIEHITGRGGWTTYATSLADPDSMVANAAWTAMGKHAGRGDIAEILHFADTAHPTVANAMRARATALDG